MEVITYIENFFDKFGLMTADNAILKRAIFGSLIGGFIITYFKPSIMFKEDGEPRAFSLIEDDPEATVFPWWAFALSTGLFSSVFI